MAQANDELAFVFWPDFILALANQGLRPGARERLSSLIHPRLIIITYNPPMTRQGARVAAALFLPGLLGGPRAFAARAPQASAEPLVDFAKIHPSAILDIRYATKNNFVHEAVYPEAKCLLRASVARSLAAAAADFEEKGLRLVVFDCYRPLSVQKKFWALLPDERYVANPAKGSNHNRGAAVDVTLADARGRELPMPTAYDDSGPRSHRDWKGSSPEERKNMRLLETVMLHHGFVGLPTEWWHFDAKGWERYPVEDAPLR